MKQSMMRALPKLAFFVILLVLCFAGLRGEPVPQVFDGEDKLHHWAGFACLTLSAYLAFPRTRLFWLLLWPLLGSMVIELGQSLLPLRTASWGDMLANALGVSSGMLVILVMQRCQRIKLKKPSFADVTKH